MLQLAIRAIQMQNNMKRPLLYIICIAFSLACCRTNRLYVDSPSVKCEIPLEGEDGLSNRYYPVSDSLFWGVWQIRYKNNAIAAEAFRIDDTLMIQQYWENGNTKTKEWYLKKERVRYMGFCSNGILIFDQSIDDVSGYTFYYCNGNKRMEFDATTTLFTAWYENGNISEQGHYYGHKLVGEWKVYDTLGVLESKMVYDSTGMLITEIKLK